MAMTLDGITLPDGLQWVDKFQSSGVIQNVKRTLDGGLVVFHAPKIGGRPVTLESSSDGGWVKKSVVAQLQLIANVAGGVYTLTIHSETHSVMFRHNEGVAFEASPLIPNSIPNDNDYYTVKLRLMTT